MSQVISRAAVGFRTRDSLSKRVRDRIEVQASFGEKYGRIHQNQYIWRQTHEDFLEILKNDF